MVSLISRRPPRKIDYEVSHVRSLGPSVLVNKSGRFTLGLVHKFLSFLPYVRSGDLFGEDTIFYRLDVLS